MRWILCIFLMSCQGANYVAMPENYKTIDTIYVSKNGFGNILCYAIVIRDLKDSSLHLLKMNKNGLIYKEPKKR